MSNRFLLELFDETLKKDVLGILENNEEFKEFRKSFKSSDVKKTCKFTVQSNEVPSLWVLVIVNTEWLETFLLGEDGRMLSNKSRSRRLGYITNDGQSEDPCKHDGIKSLVKHLMKIDEIEVNFYELDKFKILGLGSVRDLFTESDNESQEKPKEEPKEEEEVIVEGTERKKAVTKKRAIKDENDKWVIDEVPTGEEIVTHVYLGGEWIPTEL